MDIIWQVVYWGNLFMGSFVNKFFQKYWVSGHFSIGSRIKASCKTLLIMMIAGIIFLSLIGGCSYYLIKENYDFQESFFVYGKIAMLVMSNVYGTLLLVILLSYGLAFLPFSIWKRSNNSQLVY